MNSQSNNVSEKNENAATPPDEKSNKKISLAKNLSFSAVFAALCCVTTMFLHIPQPVGGESYSNLGDIFSLLAGWFLGPVYGAAAAGVGGMLADILLGGAEYAPATFIIKALMAVIGYFVWVALRKVIKQNKFDFAARIISSIPAEAVMIFGYFFYESLFLGLGWGAAANIIYNVFQGLTGLIGAVVLVSALYPVKQVKEFFPRLK